MNKLFHKHFFLYPCHIDLTVISDMSSGSGFVVPLKGYPKNVLKWQWEEIANGLKPRFFGLLGVSRYVD